METCKLLVKCANRWRVASNNNTINYYTRGGLDNWEIGNFPYRPIFVWAAFILYYYVIYKINILVLYYICLNVINYSFSIIRSCYVVE